MERFHRLKIVDGKPVFEEVVGEAVTIGDGIEAFFVRPPSGEWSCLYDAKTGARITDVFDTDDEAIDSAKRAIVHAESEEGATVGWWAYQVMFAQRFGAPPEEVEVIQEPPTPGEIRTCVRE